MAELLSAIVVHQLDLDMSGLMFEGSLLKKSDINIPHSDHKKYILKGSKNITEARFKEEESSYETDTQQEFEHGLTGKESRTLKMVVITLVKKSLQDAKLKSSAFHPLLTAINLKPDTEINESE